MITGASSGIGLALTKELLNHEVHLLLAIRDPIKMTSSFKMKGKARSINIAKMDLKDRGSIERGLDKLGEVIEQV
ncbi:MAG: SDR family NAD(P)-dependent oxidoreductase [bacterium]